MSNADRIQALQREAQTLARGHAAHVARLAHQLEQEAAALAQMPINPGIAETARMLAATAGAHATRIEAIACRS